MGTFKICQCLRRRRRAPSCLALLTLAFCFYLCYKTVVNDSSLLRRGHVDTGNTQRSKYRVHSPSLNNGEEVGRAFVPGADFGSVKTMNRYGKLLLPAEKPYLGVLNFTPTVNSVKIRATVTNSVGKTQNAGVKYLILLGHYEQLGMSTVNLLHGLYLSSMIKRRIVEPVVRHARFCGIPVGWSGQIRRNTRRFIPLSTYYNVSHFNLLLEKHGSNGFVKYSEFAEKCAASLGQRLTVLYFLYKEDSMKYLKLSDGELQELRHNARSKGWIRCDFINDKLKLQERFESDIRIGKQICIDPDVITNASFFSNDIFGKDQCVGVLLWRGVGDKKTHFNVTAFPPAKSLLPLLNPSNLITEEVKRFSAKFGLHRKKYIGVHIRSERQILWLGLARFKKCMNLLRKVVKEVQREKKIGIVLVASDAGQYGSDQLHPYLNATDSNTVQHMISNFTKSVKGLNYQVRQVRHPLWTDTGLVALVELHLLAQSDQLITLGAGTFQNWLIDTFKNHKMEIQSDTWSIVRACTKESRKLL